MSTTTERCYDVEGGTLKVVLTTDHSPSPRQYDALDGVAGSYLSCFEKVHRELVVGDDDDRALWKLGGVENICAG